MLHGVTLQIVSFEYSVRREESVSPILSAFPNDLIPGINNCHSCLRFYYSIHCFNGLLNGLGVILLVTLPPFSMSGRLHLTV